MNDKTKISVGDLKRQFSSREEVIPIGGFQIDEDLWGPGSTSEIMLFLANEYDQRTMPKLAAGEVNGREGLWLLGWDNEGTRYSPLLVHIFGQEYADERLAAMKMRSKLPPKKPGRFGFGHHRVRP